jgi:riboflavin-specific deaminase-like protein
MALERLLDLTANPPSPDALYTRIDFPPPPADRPYLYMNMVATVDGKIVIGDVGGSAAGVGGPTDQMLFRRLQHLCDAAMLGGVTLRASQVIYPPETPRFVVTRRGDVPLDNRFFTDAPDRAYILAPEDLPEDAAARLKDAANLLQVGNGGVDLTAAMRRLRLELGIRTLLCEGGASLNDALIRAGLADELFLTIAPKLKGGARLPTIMTGQGFPPGQSLPLTLRSLYRDGDEIYLRYRLGT